MKTISITTPLLRDAAVNLTAGDQVLLSGYIYTARDAAHKRFASLLAEGKELPINLDNQIIYYAGPTPAPPGMVIGSAGPTTSSRMDTYAPDLISQCGLRAMIGKGNRNKSVIESLCKHDALYFAAVGGAGALISQCIQESTVVCYSDLGPEAVRRLKVVDMPLTVAIDSSGNNLYVNGPQKYRDMLNGCSCKCHEK